MPKNKKTKKQLEKDALIKMAGDLGVNFLDRIPEKIEKKYSKIIPERIMIAHQMMAFEGRGKSVKVAMVDSQNVEARNILTFLAERNNVIFDIYLVSSDIFQDMLVKYHTAEKAVRSVVESFEDTEKNTEGGSKKKEKDENIVIQDAPVSKLAQVIISHAIEGRASDIHIEPMNDEYRVRFRIDGSLHASLVLPKNVGVATLAHIKILSNLKIDETRKPQDGRFKMSKEKMMTEEDVDFRVSTLPVIGGEKVVMRILTKDDRVFDLEKLGLKGMNHDFLSKKIKETSGIILMTGPTGSGKSTTLYSFLKIINQEDRNIVTLEDPVEYSLDGINQSQINPAIGYSFANGLRSILRQDPNVIMIGEIRDGETAELAIHAALTGHLVFSTLHTNSAISAIPRLIDMGIEPFLLASSLTALAAQRLVRRLCDHCKVEETLPGAMHDKVIKILQEVKPEEAKRYGVKDFDLNNLKFYKPVGCKECSGSGFKGRVAIYDCVDVNNDLREVMMDMDEMLLKRVARKRGLLNMRQDGLLKVAMGLTSVSEVERMTEGSLTVGELDDDKG